MDYHNYRPRTAGRREADGPSELAYSSPPPSSQGASDSLPSHLHSVADAGGSHHSSPHQIYSPPQPPPAGKDGWLHTAYASAAPEIADHLGMYHPQPVHGQHRSLSPALSSGSTNVASSMGSPPLQYADGKEVYQTYTQPIPIPKEHEKTKQRICGLSRCIFILLLLVIVLVLAGLGAGLGVGLGLKKSSSHNSGQSSAGNDTYIGGPDLAIGGALNPAYYSTKGAFNGSGIAFAGESFVDKEHGIFTIYFQHWTGSLRWMQLSPGGSYIGGSPSEIVATDAKNSTPLSVVAYAINSTSKWHLFYIGQDGYIKQKSNSNVTNIWQDGPATALNLKALDSDSVGLQACWYGNFYGDSDAAKFPTSNGSVNEIPFDIDYGMHLWYASDETTFQQYGIYEGEEQWIFEKTWSGFNGHAGVGCYSWGPGTVSYAMMVNLDDAVEIYWKDTNSSITSTEAHPVNSWVNATNASIPDAFPATSLGYTTFFYLQLLTTEIQGYNITFAAENTTIENDITVSTTEGAVQALGGTHMSVSAVADSSGGVSLYVFAQEEGDDISVFFRDVDGGQWGTGTLPIPDE